MIRKLLYATLGAMAWRYAKKRLGLAPRPARSRSGQSGSASSRF